MLLARFKVFLIELYPVITIALSLPLWVFFRVLDKLGAREASERITYGFARGWARFMFACLGCHVTVEGEEHIPCGQAFVAMGNHQSKYDAFLFLAHLNVRWSFASKPELFRIPMLAFWMRQLRCIPLDRSDVGAGVIALQKLGRDLKQRSGAFVIFPEGTRSRDPKGMMLPFRAGSLSVALDEGLPVLPVILDGTRLISYPEPMAAVPRGERLIRIRILPLRQTAGMTPRERKQFMDDLEQTIAAVWKEIRMPWPAGWVPP